MTLVSRESPAVYLMVSLVFPAVYPEFLAVLVVVSPGYVVGSPVLLVALLAVSLVSLVSGSYQCASF